MLFRPPVRFDSNPKIEKGIKVFTTPDLRWKRRDIKTIALLPQVLSKQNSVDQGGYEAWMLDEEDGDVAGHLGDMKGKPAV